MRIFVCLILSLALTSSVFAQGRTGMVKQRLSSAVTKVRDFFHPAGGRYSGLQNTIAGLTMLGLVCTSVTGCAIKHSTENRHAVEAWQNLIVLGGTLTTVGMLFALPRETEDWEREAFDRDDWEIRFDPLYLLIPVTVTVGGVMWQKSAVYVSPETPAVQSQETIDVEREAYADLQNYFRTHLAPKTVSAEDGWVAIPITEQPPVHDDPLTGLFTSIADAEAIFYGHQQEEDAEGNMVFKFDAVKYKNTEVVQTLAENEVFSVVRVAGGE